MADFLFGDSANYAPDEITVDGTKYRRADLPNIINPSIHLFPLVEQEQPASSQTISIFPTTNTVIVTPATVEFNGRPYRKTM
jgi:hypothetical protein